MDKRIYLLVFLALASATGLYLWGPISQDPAYHNFADNRTMWGIPNALNVLSNIPFVLVGVLGLKWCGEHWRDRWLAAVFSLGVLITAFGSGYYHLDPRNETLFWDRLPMTLGFMSLFAAVIAIRINRNWGIACFPLLMALGVFSVIYWSVGESHGHGDLRLYAWVQFFPMLAIPLILTLYPSQSGANSQLALAGLFYLLAKLLEYFDSQVFSLGGIVSGHSIKHLLAALASYFILRMFWSNQG